MDTDEIRAPAPDDLSHQSAVRLTVAATALAFVVRVSGIFRRDMWEDEIDFWIGSLTAHKSAQAGPLPGNLYGVVAHVFSSVDPLLFRWVSVFLGAAAIPAAYLLGRKIVNRRVGAITAFVAAVSPTSWYWAQELRPYALYQLVTTLAAAFFVAGYVNDEGGKWRFRYFVALVLAFLTHLLTIPFAESLLAFSALSLAFRRSRRDVLRFAELMGVTLAAAGLGLLWLRQRWHPITGVMDGGYLRGPVEFFREVIWGLGPTVLLAPGHVAFFDLPALAILGVALVGLIHLDRVQFRPRAWLSPILIVPTIVALYLQLGKKSNWIWSRYMVHLVPFYAVLIATGLAALMDRSSRKWRWVAAAVVFALYVPDFVRSSIFGQMYPGVNSRDQAPVIAREAAHLQGIILADSKAVSPERRLNAYPFYRQDHLPIYFISSPGVLVYDDSLLAHPPIPMKSGRRFEGKLPAGDYAVLSWYGADDQHPCEGLGAVADIGACRDVKVGEVPTGLRFVSVGKRDGS